MRLTVTAIADATTAKAALRARPTGTRWGSVAEHTPPHQAPRRLVSSNDSCSTGTFPEVLT